MTRRAVVMLVMILCLAGFAGQSWAATSDSISVSVYLAEVCVDLDFNLWTIGGIALGESDGPESFTATNGGNVAIDLTISATNGGGGWLVRESAGANEFRVALSSPSLNLRAYVKTLATDVAASGTKGIALTYYAPTSDTFGVVGQGFTITVSAALAAP